MKIIKKVWEWISKHSVPIIIGLIVFLYSWANVQAQKIKNDQQDADFKCQTLCFPQQHEYLFAGEIGSCWCYSNSDELKRYKE